MLASAGGGGNGTYKLPDSLFIGDDSTQNVTPIDTGINKDLVQYKFEEKLVKHDFAIPNYNLKWGQRNPEGLLCPNSISGCTNTAMLMIMSYFKAPQTLKINYTEDVNELLYIDWDAILKHEQSVYDPSALFDYCTIHNNHTRAD